MRMCPHYLGWMEAVEFELGLDNWYARLALILLLLTAPCLAQSTAVSATITDTDGNPWANGSYLITFVPNPAYPSLSSYIWSGGNLQQNSLFQGYMDATGHFAGVSVPRNDFITPAKSQWQVTICPLATSGCASLVVPFTTTSLDLTSQLSAIAKGPRFADPGIAYGYTTNNVYPLPKPGTIFFNDSPGSLACYQWNGASWQLCGGGGGGALTVQTDGTPNHSQSLLNFVDPGAFNGLNFAFSNPSGGIETMNLSGTLNNSGLTNSSTVVNGQTCVLGGSCTVSGSGNVPALPIVYESGVQTAVSQVFAGHPVSITITVPSGCTGSAARTYPTSNGGAAPTATGSTTWAFVDFTTSTTLCSFLWSASGSIASVSGSGGTISPNDSIGLVGAAAADATLANVGAIINGTTIGSGGVATSWSALTNPTSNLVLTMLAYASKFTYNAATGAADLFELTDTASNTGTGNILHVHTQSGSTETPFQADANGCGWRVASNGQLQSVGSCGSGHFVQFAPQTFSVLSACASGIEGQTAAITDSTTNTWGATITGGGTNHVLGYCDGTVWTVAAK